MMLYISEEFKEITKALSNLQGKLENVTRNKKAHQYNYADLGACIEELRDPLRDNGFAVTQIICKEEGELVLITLLLHISGQWIKSTFPIPDLLTLSGNKMQELGKVISYGRRYSLSAITGLAQEDNDAATAHKDKGRNDSSPPYSPRIEQKESIKQSSSKEDPYGPLKEQKELIGKLRELCAEHNADMVDFGKFFKLNSTDIPQMTDIIDNFKYRYDYYVEAKAKGKDEIAYEEVVI